MTFYLGKTPESAMKPTTIFFYASDGDEAKELSLAERVALRAGFSRDATTFDGITEPCTRVVIMPGVTGHHYAKIEAAYGDKVVLPPGDDTMKVGPAGNEPREMVSVPADGVEREIQVGPDAARDSARRGRTTRAPV